MAVSSFRAIRRIAAAASASTPSPTLSTATILDHRAPYSSSSSSSAPPSPTKRQNPRSKMEERLSSVIDTVNDRKLPPELRGQRNSVRSETDIINVVEQRIYHSMEEGQFENLPGKGKPLNLSTNPHADPAEDTLYRILSKNGCAPEWVELNKEIRNNVVAWRAALQKASSVDVEWMERSEALKTQLRAINDKVFRYNLIVPFGRQMNGLKWEKEVEELDRLKGPEKNKAALISLFNLEMHCTFHI